AAGTAGRVGLGQAEARVARPLDVELDLLEARGGRGVARRVADAEGVGGRVGGRAGRGGRRLGVDEGGRVRAGRRRFDVAGVVVGAGVEAVVAVAGGGRVGEAAAGTAGRVGLGQAEARVARPLDVELDLLEARGGRGVARRVADAEGVGGREGGRAGRGSRRLG